MFGTQDLIDVAYIPSEGQSPAGSARLGAYAGHREVRLFERDKVLHESPLYTEGDNDEMDGDRMSGDENEETGDEMDEETDDLLNDGTADKDETDLGNRAEGLVDVDEVFEDVIAAETDTLSNLLRYERDSPLEQPMPTDLVV